VKIEKIGIYHVSMPLIYPWRTAYGEDANIHSILVKMVSSNEYGWGETSPLNAPCYSPEWAGGVFSLIKEFLAPQIIGKNIESAEQLLLNLQNFKGNPFAKAGLETAWWVLQSKLAGKPLHQMLGGADKPVIVGADFGIQDSINILLNKIQKSIDEGYPRVKLKFKRGWDINMLEAVRDRFPSHIFHIDCNSGFALADLDLFRKVDRFNLAMIEQPLYYADLVDHAKLQKEISTPICLDESIISLKEASQAIELGSCRYMNIKVGRVGGLLNAVKIHDMCKASSIPCWVGGMLESAVGSGISIELATLDNFIYPSDLFPSRNFYQEDLSYPEIKLHSRGKIDISKVPGIPYEPKGNKLEQEVIDKTIIVS